MGSYVSNPPTPAFDWGDSQYSGTGSDLTKELVEAKFAATMTTAESMLEKLVGTDGNSGYLGTLNSIIATYSVPEIPDFSVSIPSLSITTDTRPDLDLSGLDMDFPEFTTAAPSLLAIPVVDLSNLEPATPPEAITAAISWIEQDHDETLFTELLTRILADLQTGATGLSVTVEADIFARALARQNLEEDRIQQEIADFNSGFDLPPLAQSARLAEHANARAMRILDLNGQILKEQADLAQKNSQFIIQVGKDLEAVLRDFTSKQNDRSLDFAKAVAANTIAIYSEAVKTYLAVAEANKMYVEVQVENLKAIVESNKGLVASFAAEAEAYGVVIEAKSQKNKAITDAFESEVKGYEAETRAISSNQQAQVEEYKARLLSADIQLRAAIAEIEAEIQAYSTESSLREKVAEAMANIAMQAVASAYGSVNASAGLSHQTGRHESESFTHSENRSDGYDHSESINESHPFEEQAVS